MAVYVRNFCRWAAAATLAAALHAGAPATGVAQDYCPPGYARFCENAHVDDVHAEDCDDGWGILSSIRDWREDYHRRKRDKRRHLYYKAQNSHYDLFYPRCPPDWSATHGYHTTQWNPFPGEGDPRLMSLSPMMLTPAGPPQFLPASPGPAITPPVVPPADSGGATEPYFPPPVPGNAPPPPPPAEPVTEPVIRLMDFDGARLQALKPLPPPDNSTKPSGIILLDSTGDDWVPTKQR